jgi:hypothetical protein
VALLNIWFFFFFERKFILLQAQPWLTRDMLLKEKAKAQSRSKDGLRSFLKYVRMCVCSNFFLWGMQTDYLRYLNQNKVNEIIERKMIVKELTLSIR